MVNKDRLFTVAFILALGIAVGSVFGPALRHPFSVMDDESYILLNPEIVRVGDSSLANLLLQTHGTYVIPVAGLSKAALFALGGGQPFIFHLTNLLVHTACAILLFLLIRRCTGRLWAAAILSLGFALHPVVVEPVVWATGLKDLLMAFFCMLGTYLWVGPPQQEEGSNLGRGKIAALGCAVLSMLSKPTAALVPLVWVAYDFSRHSFRRFPGAIRMLTWAGFILALHGLLAFMSWFMQQTFEYAGDKSLSAGHFDAAVALGFQLRNLLWPVALFPRYPDLHGRGLNDPLSWVGLFAALVFGIWLVLSRRRPPVLMGLLLAVCTYLPVSNLLPFRRMVADSYLYVPLMGLMLAVSAWWASFSERLSLRRTLFRTSVGPRFTWVIALLAVLLSFFVLWLSAQRSREQVERWGSPTGLWIPALERYPDWVWPWFQMAEGLRFLKQPETALKVYEQLYARAYVPQYLPNVAVALILLERFSDAECVINEDFHYGLDTERALRNLALLLVSHPSYVPRYPTMARHALDTAEELSQKRELHWPADLEGLIAEHRKTLPVVAENLGSGSWPLRNCEVLRAPKQDSFLWQKTR